MADRHVYCTATVSAHDVAGVSAPALEAVCSHVSIDALVPVIPPRSILCSLHVRVIVVVFFLSRTCQAFAFLMYFHEIL